MEVANRYAEQFQTTVETMKRRCIAGFDAACLGGERIASAADNVRETYEPMFYDVKDEVSTAVSDMSPLDAGNTAVRNTLLELYLGCAVLAVGLSAGEIAGALALTPLLDMVFDWYWEITIAILYAYYLYVCFTKGGAVDETENRVSMFGMGFFVGCLIGHMLGYRIVDAMPALCFLQPFILALVVDAETLPASSYSNRTTLLGISLGAGAGVVLIGTFLFGLSGAAFVSIVAQAALLFVHFQMVHRMISAKTYSYATALLGYLVGTMVMQMLVAAVLGNSDYGQQQDAEGTVPAGKKSA